jgi:hypothetical protein
MVPGAHGVQAVEPLFGAANPGEHCPIHSKRVSEPESQAAARRCRHRTGLQEAWFGRLVNVPAFHKHRGNQIE